MEGIIYLLNQSGIALAQANAGIDALLTELARLSGESPLESVSDPTAT